MQRCSFSTKVIQPDYLDTKSYYVFIVHIPDSLQEATGVVWLLVLIRKEIGLRITVLFKQICFIKDTPCILILLLQEFPKATC